MNAIASAAAYATIPAATVFAGGAIAAKWPPSPRFASYVQHFAAGVVLAALATELLPEVLHRRAPIAAALGFLAGTVLMLVIRELAEGKPDLQPDGASAHAKGGQGSASLTLTIGIDLLIDGFLIGLGFAAGARTGALLTVALSIEVLFLGLSTARPGMPPRKVLSTTATFGALLIVGALAGSALGGVLTGVAMEAALAFAASALVYLVTEELLTEAHEVPETPLSTAMLSFGFLTIVVIDMVA